MWLCARLCLACSVQERRLDRQGSSKLLAAQQAITLVHDMESDRLMCAVALSMLGGGSVCDVEPVQPSTTDPTGCCRPRRLDYSSVSTPKPSHWAFHDLSELKEPPSGSFWINTHDPKDEDTFVSAALHRRQKWEPEIVSLFRRTLLHAPQGLVLDVGANLGYFTLVAAAMGHRVIAFEPMNFNLRRLASSLRRNDFASNVTVYQNTVGNLGGRLSLQPTNALNKGNFQVAPR